MDRYVHVQHAQVRDGGPNLDPVWDECFLAVAGSDNERGAVVALTVMDSNAGAIVDGSDDFL